MSVQALSLNAPLEQQLHELEDLYAECLIDNTDTKTLTILWARIKEIRGQLTIPIYDTGTHR